MGLLSSIKQWNKEMNEFYDAESEKDFIAKRQKRKKKIDKFIHQGGYTVGTKCISVLPETLGTRAIDDLLMEYAPNLSWMLTELYLCKEETLQLREIVGRYEELKERHEELKEAYETQRALLTELSKMIPRT
ncbi:MAG: hypothetical protein ACFN1I_00950 [Selenomonas artemidis]